MKVHQSSTTKHLKITFALMTIFLLMVIFSGCSKETATGSKSICLGTAALPAHVVEDILPTYEVSPSHRPPYYLLSEGNTVETFDPHAVGAVETGIATNWYPQYLATVVIAVNRDKTSASIDSWSDLPTLEEEVGFLCAPKKARMLIMAMAYGLEGEGYTLKTVLPLLSSLHDNHLFQMSSSDSPILICYDFQAATLKSKGQNLEIIVPSEGTLTYEKGFLSNESLVFSEDTEEILLLNGFRLLDGRCDSSLYPEEEAYLSASQITDYEHFATTSRNVCPRVFRSVLKEQKFMSIDYREHLFFALIYICIVTFWIAYIFRRSMQKGIRYSAVFTGIILDGWVLVRLIKYQVVAFDTLSRYLWYSYYIFQLSLPLVILWMAWAMDKPERETYPPKWWKGLAILTGLMILYCFHQ